MLVSFARLQKTRALTKMFPVGTLREPTSRHIFEFRYLWGKRSVSTGLGGRFQDGENWKITMEKSKEQNKSLKKCLFTKYLAYQFQHKKDSTL